MQAGRVEYRRQAAPIHGARLLPASSRFGWSGRVSWSLWCESGGRRAFSSLRVAHVFSRPSGTSDDFVINSKLTALHRDFSTERSFPSPKDKRLRRIGCTSTRSLSAVESVRPIGGFQLWPAILNLNSLGTWIKEQKLATDAGLLQQVVLEKLNRGQKLEVLIALLGEAVALVFG